jgi:hypothetical protein
MYCDRDGTAPAPRIPFEFENLRKEHVTRGIDFYDFKTHSTVNLGESVVDTETGFLPVNVCNRIHASTKAVIDEMSVKTQAQTEDIETPYDGNAGMVYENGSVAHTPQDCVLENVGHSETCPDVKGIRRSESLLVKNPYDAYSSTSYIVTREQNALGRCLLPDAAKYYDEVYPEPERKPKMGDMVTVVNYDNPCGAIIENAMYIIKAAHEDLYIGSTVAGYTMETKGSDKRYMNLVEKSKAGFINLSSIMKSGSNDWGAIKVFRGGPLSGRRWGVRIMIDDIFNHRVNTIGPLTRTNKMDVVLTMDVENKRVSWEKVHNAVKDSTRNNTLFVFELAVNPKPMYRGNEMIEHITATDPTDSRSKMRCQLLSMCMLKHHARELGPQTLDQALLSFLGSAFKFEFMMNPIKLFSSTKSTIRAFKNFFNPPKPPTRFQDGMVCNSSGKTWSKELKITDSSGNNTLPQEYVNDDSKTCCIPTNVPEIEEEEEVEVTKTAEELAAAAATIQPEKHYCTEMLSYPMPQTDQYLQVIAGRDMCVSYDNDGKQIQTKCKETDALRINKVEHNSNSDFILFNASSNGRCFGETADNCEDSMLKYNIYTNQVMNNGPESSRKCLIGNKTEHDTNLRWGNCDPNNNEQKFMFNSLGLNDPNHNIVEIQSGHGPRGDENAAAMCLVASDDLTVNGSEAVTLEYCQKADDRRKWLITGAPQSGYTLKNRKYIDKCLTLGIPQKGDLPYIDTCVGTDLKQKWAMHNNRLVNMSTHSEGRNKLHCIDTKNRLLQRVNRTGREVPYMHECKGGNLNQEFSLMRVFDVYEPPTAEEYVEDVEDVDEEDVEDEEDVDI